MKFVSNNNLTRIELNINMKLIIFFAGDGDRRQYLHGQ